MRADLVPLASSWLLTYLLHSTLLLTGSWLLCRRQVQSPAIREILWKTALVGSLVSATLQVGFGLEPIGGALPLAATRQAKPTIATGQPWNGVLVNLPASEPASRPSPAELQAAPAPTDRSPAAPPAPVPTASVDGTSFSLPGLLPLALGGWAVLALALFALYLIQRIRAMRRIGPRRPVTDDGLLTMLEALRRAGRVRRPIRLTTAAGLGSPVALGQTEIVFPEAALTQLDQEQQRSMLAHELAHLARLDPSWLTLACIIERLFFIQPLNRLARLGMQETAELLCDDWAVSRTGSGFSLATCLVKVAEWVDTAPQPIPLAGMAEHRSQLVTRIHRLIEGRTMSTSPRSLWLAAGAVLLLGVTAVAAPGVTTIRQQPSADRQQDPDGWADSTLEDASAPIATADAMDALALTGAEVADTDDTAASRRRRDRIREMERQAARASTIDSRRALTELLAETRLHTPRPPRTPRPALAPMPTMAGISTSLFAPPMRLEVGRAFGRSWNQSGTRDTNNIAVPALIAALKDTDVNVRRAAVQSLGNLQDPRSVPGLIEATRDGDAEVRAGAVNALGNLEDARATPALVAALKDSNKDVRYSALSALHSMPGAVPDDAILSALDDADADIRQAAMQLALHRMSDHEDDENFKPDPRYLAAFIRLLTDANADVRQAVARSLGKIGDPRGVPTLKELLADGNADVRECAVQGLSEIRDRAALEALVSALKSSDPEVRRAAAEALGQRED